MSPAPKTRKPKTPPAWPAEMWVRQLRALADATRLRITASLLRQSLSVNEIAERLDLLQYNVSKHLRVLRRAGIVDVHAVGANREYFIAPKIRNQVDKKKRTTLDFGCCTFRFDRLEN